MLDLLLEVVRTSCSGIGVEIGCTCECVVGCG